MKIGPFVFGKDGGPDSTVDCLMFEIKGLFSIGLLRFNNGSRDAFHSHAFNCWSWLVGGLLLEEFLDPAEPRRTYFTGALISTKREDVHRVCSFGTSYVLTVRGPWQKTWVDVEQTDSGQWNINRLQDGREQLESFDVETRREAAEFAKVLA